METEESRSVAELEAIVRFCEENKVDADRFLDDPSATMDKVAELIDIGKVVNLAPKFEIYRNAGYTNLQKNRHVRR